MLILLYELTDSEDGLSAVSLTHYKFPSSLPWEHSLGSRTLKGVQKGYIEKALSKVSLSSGSPLFLLEP